MAETKTILQQIGLTRGKATLIGVLALVLVGVVYRQLANWGNNELAERPPATQPAMDARQQPPSAERVSAAASAPGPVTLESALVELDQSRWQSPDVTEVIGYDPFALPKSFPRPTRAILDPALAGESDDSSAAAFKAQQLADAVEKMQLQLSELQQRGVHVIVNLNDEYVAMIGDRTIHVGDEINGFIVTAIEPDGVRVERKALQ